MWTLNVCRGCTMPSLAGCGRIERLEILNFKSFKCDQIVGPFKNFAAIISANGAGRTDLVDAISFVLGVRSFQLRGAKPKDPLNGHCDRECPEPRARLAFVKLVFSTGSGEEIKFGRAITSSGTSEYRINNIPVTWEIYNNTMKGLDILGEIESDTCKDFKEPNPISEPLSAPEELKKIHAELEIQKARAEEKKVPTYQKRKMTAAERKQKREQKKEADDQLRLRAEMDLRSAELRLEMDFKGKIEPLSADIVKAASDFEALDQYETSREKERKSLEELDAARKAATEFANKRKLHKLSSRLASPLPVIDEGDAAAKVVDVTKVVDATKAVDVTRVVDATKAVDVTMVVDAITAVNATKAVDATKVAGYKISKPRSNIKDGVVKEKGTGIQNVSISKDMLKVNSDELSRDGGVPLEVKSKERKMKSLQRNSSPNGKRPPVVEKKRTLTHGSHKPAEVPSRPDATNSDPHTLRHLEDYDDQMYWSDMAEDQTDPDKDSLTKAELLSEELYRDAMEMQSRLFAAAQANAALTASGVSLRRHNLIAETKEICGAIMYANGHVQNSGSGMLGEESALIPAGDCESKPLSFSQVSQCSDTPESTLGQTESLHLDGMEVGQREGLTDLDGDVEGSNTKGHDRMMITFVDDFRDSEKDGDSRSAMEKEMERLRGSNVRKQVKIDSLQKWKAYYSFELEAKDRQLEHIEKGRTKELKKKDRAVRKMEKAHAEEISDLDSLREEVEDKLRGEIKELNLVIEELSGQLYDMEEHLAAGGIPYKPAFNENTGPSSKTLLSAVISVREAAHTFSRTFMSYLKQHLTKARDLDEQICLESEVIVARPSDYKFLVQSFICRRMFLDFDSECYNIESCMTEIFDIEEHSRACFQEYISHRNVADTVTLLTDNRPHSAFLREFCFKKFLHIVSESTEEAFFGDFNHSDDICAGRHPSSRFYESYCKLAVSVWLLHRLAFSFQPQARTISVRKGAQFNPTYMESAVPGIAGDDLDGSALPFEALVGLMVHPGFRVGSSIIPAQVYLVTT